MTTSSPDIRLSDDVLRQLHENMANMFQTTDMQDMSTILGTIKQTIEYTQNPAKYYEPITMTAEQAAEYGLEVPEGWTLQTQMGAEGEISFSMIDPDGWGIDDGGNYTAPDGTTFTQAELEETMNIQDVIERNTNSILSGISEVIGMADWPEEMKAESVTGETILSWALQSEENSNAFIQGLWNVGTKGFDSNDQQLIDDSFAALGYLGFTDDQLRQIFPAYNEQKFQEEYKDYNWAEKLRHNLWVSTFGSQWFSGAIDFITAPGAQRVAEIVAKIGGSEQDRVYIENLNHLYDLYGPMAYYTAEAHQVYEEWHAPGGGWGKFAIEMTNPAWLISGTFLFKGAAAIVAGSKALSAVPALLTVTETAARLVQFAEAVPGRVIVLPFKGAGAVSRWFSGASLKSEAGIASAARSAGEAFSRDISTLASRPAVQDFAREVLPEPKYVLTKLPDFDPFAIETFALSPARRLGLATLKIPGVGRLAEKFYRYTPNAKLIAGNTQAWSVVSGDIGKISLYTQTLYGMGKSTANQVKQILRHVDYNGLKLFGLDENGISRTIKTAAGHSGAPRTLINILENPTHFKLTPKQLEYIAIIHSVLDDVRVYLLREGIVVKETAVADLGHYIHRVVEDINRNVAIGMKGRIGRTPTFMKTRTVGEVTEEVAREIAYARNPEVILESYINQAFKKIADKRMAELVEKLPGARIPLENPIYKEFVSALHTVGGGGVVKPEVISRIEQVFPDLGKRLRVVSKITTAEDKAVQKYLKQSWDQIKDLQQRLTAKEGAEALPIEKFTKAMEGLNYDDRLLFLDTFEAKMAELDRMSGEMSQELQVMKEFLETDMVAAYRGKMGGRTTSLLSLLDKSGKFPETLTPKQAELILMGRELSPTVLTAEGRVRWEYVLDQLAEHFRMTEQELINHLENLKATRLRMNDLKGLIDDAAARRAEIEGLRDAVNQVNRKAANLPESAEGRPVWATGKALPTEEELLRPPMGAKEVWPQGKGKITQHPDLKTTEGRAYFEENNGFFTDYVFTDAIHDIMREALTQPEWLQYSKYIFTHTDEDMNLVNAFKMEYKVMEGRGYIYDEGLRAWGKPVWDDFDATIEAKMAEAAPKKAPSLVTKPVSSILDEIPPVVRSSADKQAEIRAIREALTKRVHPTAKLGEQEIFHPAFRNWALDPEIVRTINYFWNTKSNAFLKIAAEAAGVLRTKAAMDFSAMMIQGLPAMGATMATLNPKYMVTWLKGWGEGLEVFLKPEVYADWAFEHNAAIQQRLSFGGTQMAADWFEATPRILGWSKHVPGAETAVRQTYGRFEAQFSFSLDYMRQTTWEALSPAAIKSGNAFKLAEMCDHMVGVTSRDIAGVPAWFRDFESAFMWFAPNYTHACLQLIGDIFRGRYMAWQAVKALSGMMAASTLVYYTYCKATGQEPQLNPFKPGFMTVTVDGFEVRLGGFWNGQARLLIDIWNSVGDNWDTPLDLFKIMNEGALNKENPVLMWWYKRSSALTHFGIDTMWQHRDYSGHELDDPLSYAKYMLECVTPIATDAMLQNVLWGDEQAGWKIFLAELIGLNTYPSSLWKALADQAAIYIKQMPSSEIEASQMQAWQKGELTWYDLTEAQQATLKLRYPDLVELENLAQDGQDRWTTPLRRDFWNAIGNAKQYRTDTGNALVDDLITGVDSAGNEFNTKSFREAVADMNTAYGLMYDLTVSDERFAEIIAEWDDRDSQDAETVDAAYYEYLELVAGGDFTGPDDVFNSKAYDDALSAFKTKWGIDIYNQILTILESNKLGENPLVVQLWRDKKTLSDSNYWDMPVDTTEQREARNNFLKNNPQIDAILFFWGYRSDLETLAAYNIVQSMCRESGVPMTAVGGTAGLPSENIVEDWLTYKQQELTGWDRQNYLRDHQALYEWGQANLGWDDIDFSKVPSPEMKKMLDDYNATDTSFRLMKRCMSQELDNWLVNVNGLVPAYGTDRCTRLGY